MRKLLLSALIPMAAIAAAQAEIPDSDIVDVNSGLVVGHIHYHEPPAPLPTPSSLAHDLDYWMNYYAQIAARAAAEAHQNAPALEAQLQRKCRSVWYGLHKESRAAWEADVPGVKQAIRQGDYAGAMDLIGSSPQFKWMLAHEKQLLKGR